LCLLLTLLAVPVFYSLFEDLSESRVWSYIGRASGGFTGGVGQRISGAWAGLAEHFPRGRARPSATQTRTATRKDDYADQTSGD
jgi:hypothetical protein